MNWRSLYLLHFNFSVVFRLWGVVIRKTDIVLLLSDLKNILGEVSRSKKQRGKTQKICHFSVVFRWIFTNNRYRLLLNDFKNKLSEVKAKNGKKFHLFLKQQINGKDLVSFCLVLGCLEKKKKHFWDLTCVKDASMNIFRVLVSFWVYGIRSNSITIGCLD